MSFHAPPICIASYGNSLPTRLSRVLKETNLMIASVCVVLFATELACQLVELYSSKLFRQSVVNLHLLLLVCWRGRKVLNLRVDYSAGRRNIFLVMYFTFIFQIYYYYVLGMTWTCRLFNSCRKKLTISNQFSCDQF